MQYVGRAPDSDATVAPKSFADSQYEAQKVTTDAVNAQIALATANLVTPKYADDQDDLRAQKADVSAADANYVAATQLGVAGGVAKIDPSGFLTAAQVPAGVRTDQVTLCYAVPTTGSISLSGTHAVTTTIPREYQIATLPIPDPGFPWRVLPFAWVRGQAGGSPALNRQSGNGNYGLLTVLPPAGVSNTVYGLGLCTASMSPDTYPLTPFAGVNQTPLSVPPINGALELGLYGCCWSGSSFNFIGDNLVYFALVIPAL